MENEDVDITEEPDMTDGNQSVDIARKRSLNDDRETSLLHDFVSVAGVMVPSCR